MATVTNIDLYSLNVEDVFVLIDSLWLFCQSDQKDIFETVVKGTDLLDTWITEFGSEDELSAERVEWRAQTLYRATQQMDKLVWYLNEIRKSLTLDQRNAVHHTMEAQRTIIRKTADELKQAQQQTAAT